MPLEVLDESTVKKKFFSNHVFTCVSGKEFWIDGELKFNTPTPDYTLEDFDKGLREKRDGSYRTQFWRCYDHDGKILADCDHNMSLALRRVTALKDPCPKRHPKPPGTTEHQHYIDYNSLLTENQRTDYLECDDFHTRLRDLYTRHFDDFSTAELEAEDHHADPHQKRDLRIQAYNDLLGCDRVAIYDVTWTSKIELKMKKDEYAKPGKYARGIADLGCPASLRGFKLTQFLKEAMAYEEVVLDGFTAVFCKQPQHDKLVSIFERLINPPGKGFFVYFSDDSCFSTRVGGKTRIFNMDISSCDASHGPTIFDGLLQIVPPHLYNDMYCLIRQCMEPLTIYSRHDRKKRVKIKPNRPVLYSGSTLTTCQNNYANLRIFRQIVKRLNDPAPIAKLTDAIMDAAEAAGYAVTLQECFHYSQIQFLKHSPAYDVHEVLHPLINFGVWLRASGNCRGDLPGSGDLWLRARAFQNALLTGLYPRITCPLIERFKAECHMDTPSIAATRAVEKMLAHKVDTSSGDVIVITDEELLRRYSPTPNEVQWFEEDLDLPPYGLHCSNPLANKVLTVDYDLRAAGYAR